MGAAASTPCLPVGRGAKRTKVESGEGKLPDFSLTSERSRRALEWLEEQEHSQQFPDSPDNKAELIARAAAAAAAPPVVKEPPVYDSKKVVQEVIRKLSNESAKGSKKDCPAKLSLQTAVDTWLSRVTSSSAVEERRGAPSPPESDRAISEMQRVRSLAKYLLVEEPEKAFVALAAAAAATKASKPAVEVSPNQAAPAPEDDTPSGSNASDSTSNGSGDGTSLVSFTGLVTVNGSEDDDNGSDVSVEDIPPVLALDAREKRAAAQENWKLASIAALNASNSNQPKPSLAHLRKTPRAERLAAGGMTPSRWGRVRIAFGFSPPNSAREDSIPIVRRTKTPGVGMMKVKQEPIPEAPEPPMSRTSSINRKHTPAMGMLKVKQVQEDSEPHMSRSSSNLSRKLTPWVG